MVKLGQAKKGQSKCVVATISLDEDTVLKLQEITKIENENHSSMIRILIRKYYTHLKREGKL